MNRSFTYEYRRENWKKIGKENRKNRKNRKKRKGNIQIRNLIP